MPNWLGDAAAVERARELLRELDADETAAWNAWAWEARATAPAFVADAARDVARDVEKLRGSLRRFAAEHERTHSSANADALQFTGTKEPPKPDASALPLVERPKNERRNARAWKPPRAIVDVTDPSE